MDLHEAYRTLHQRLYHWAVGDFHREIDQDFPLLGTIGNSRVSSLLRLMASLTVDEKTALADALVKQTYRSTLGEIGISLTPEEREYIQRYRSCHSTHLLGNDFTLAPTPATKRLTTKTKMLGLVDKSLVPILGTDVAPVGKGVVCFTTTVDNWAMKTFVGVHSKGIAQIYYYHVLDRSDRPLQYENRLLMISIMIWMGTGPTEWTLSSAPPNAIVASLTAAVSHFTAAVPSLVEGLD